jgi:hypothetical protein
LRHVKSIRPFAHSAANRGGEGTKSTLNVVAGIIGVLDLDWRVEYSSALKHVPLPTCVFILLTPLLLRLRAVKLKIISGLMGVRRLGRRVRILTAHYVGEDVELAVRVEQVVWVVSTANLFARGTRKKASLLGLPGGSGRVKVTQCRC